MHQGMGLDAYNALAMRRAVQAVYESCYSVPLAAELARKRPYRNYDAMFRQADALLFSLCEASVDGILQAYALGRHWDGTPDVRARLDTAVGRYVDRFGYGFVMCTAGRCTDDVMAAITDRMHNDDETERKVVRNELARINRIRLERMLAPEGGYDNW